MSMPDRAKEELLETDEEFRSLHQEHQECESRLEVLNAQALLSQQDEMEQKRLKRRKLWLKDRMAEKLRAHEGEPVSA